MADKSALTTTITVAAAIIAVMAVALRVDEGAQDGPRERWNEPSGSRRPRAYPTVVSAVRSFHGGEQLLNDYFSRWPGDGTAGDTSQQALRFMIVTLPDPFDSHLDWIYDAHLDALRRAFAAMSYLPDRFDLGRAADSIAIGDTTQQVRRPQRIFQPGTMLFRSSKGEGLWLVYIVHELPTTGLYQYALQAAICERARLIDSKETRTYLPVETNVLQVLGPTFSGSQESLIRSLETSWSHHGVKGRVTDLRIVTGSATSMDPQSWNRFKTWAGDSLRNTRVTVRATVHSDATMSLVFQKLAARLSGHSLDRVVVLSESQTGYGQSLPGLKHFRTIHYPLNIASLRTEFDRSAEAREDASGLPGITEGQRTALSLDPSTQPQESPGLTSRLSVPTLDLVLRDIERTLIAERAEVVLIVATDVRDKLILARTLRHRLRDVVFVIYEDNMLYLREEYSHALRGAYVLSTYPLVNASGDVLRGTDTALSRPISFFGHDLAIGVFNAAVTLADREPLRAQWPGDSTACPIPPVWVSIVGNGTQFPLQAEYPAGAGYGFIHHVISRRSERGYLTTIRAWNRNCLKGLDPSGLRSRTRKLFWVLVSILFAWGMSWPDNDAWRWQPFGHDRGKKRLQWPAIKRAEPIRTLRQLLVAAYWRLALLIPVAGIAGAVTLNQSPTWSRWIVPLGAIAVGVMARTVWARARIQPVKWLSLTDVDKSLSGEGDPPRDERKLLRDVCWQEAVCDEFILFPSDNEDITDPRRVHRKRDNLWYRAPVQALMNGLVGAYWLGMTFVAGWWLWKFSNSPRTELTTWLLEHRNSDLAGGASPAGVMIVLGLILALWSWWQYSGVRDFARPSAFEVALKDFGRDYPGTSLLRSLGHQMWRIRATLVDYLPDESSILPLLVLITAVLVSIVGLRDFGPSLEAITRTSGQTAFSIATWLGLAGVVTVTVVGILRFTAVWQALEGLLELFAGSRMLKVFRSIPTDIVRAARPALLGEQSWRAPGFGIRPNPRGVAADKGAVDWRPRVIDQSELIAISGVRQLTSIAVPFTLTHKPAGHLGALRTLAEALDRMGMFEQVDPPEPKKSNDENGGTAEEPVPTPKEHPDRPSGTPLSAEAIGIRKVLAFHLALEMGLFVAQTMFALRRLAVTIVLSLTLSIILTRIYPWQAQSLLTWSLATMMIWALAMLSYVIAKMSVQPVLHEIAQTSDTGANWGLTVVFNLVVFTVLPLLGYLATSIPSVRSFLVSWLEPITRSLAR